MLGLGRGRSGGVELDEACSRTEVYHTNLASILGGSDKTRSSQSLVLETPFASFWIESRHRRRPVSGDVALGTGLGEFILGIAELSSVSIDQRRA